MAVAIEDGGRDYNGSTVLHRDGTFTSRVEDRGGPEQHRNGRITDAAAVFAQIERLWAQGHACQLQEPSHHEAITVLRVIYDEYNYQSRVIFVYPTPAGSCPTLTEIQRLVDGAIQRAQ